MVRRDISPIGAGLAAGILLALAPLGADAQTSTNTVAASTATASTAPVAPVTAAAPGGALEGAQPTGSLVLLFATGSSSLNRQHEALLDQASRLYREGRPIIMIVTGGTDAVGVPAQNLLLSQQRATAVFRGMVARGIPAERCQILAKGETNPAVPASRGIAEAQNRRVEITWR